MSPSRPAPRRRRQAGHTLVELVAVATITSVMLTIAMRASQPMTASAISQRDRAVASSELRLAVESLLADLEGVVAAMRQAGTDQESRRQRLAALAERARLVEADLGGEGGQAVVPPALSATLSS